MKWQAYDELRHDTQILEREVREMEITNAEKIRKFFAKQSVQLSDLILAVTVAWSLMSLIGP